MKQGYVAVIALLSISSCIFQAYAQDIIFPGETERPPRFPLNPPPGQGQPNGPRPNNPNGGITQEQYNACVNKCPFTSEYNPVCGSDGVTYKNIGAFNCAVNCGNPIQNSGRGQCTPASPAPVQPSPDNQPGENNQITQEKYDDCINNCRFTSEYNPVCGSDRVTYQNIGALNCALHCGNPIRNLGKAPCDRYFA